MKNIIYIILMTLTPIFAFSQVYVKAPNGDVGVGTDTPSEKLEVAGDTKTEGAIIQKSGASASISCESIGNSAFAFGAGIQGGFTVDENYHLQFKSNTRTKVLNRQISSGKLLLRFQSLTGWAGFGTGSPASAMHVNGSITYNGSLNNASDRRLKKNINSFNYGLDEILQLNPVMFEYNGKANLKNTDQQQIGLVAQELEEVAPELVSTFTYEEEDDKSKVIKSEEYLMIKESSIKYMLINAVKEQQETIDSQESEIASLREDVAEMKEMVQALLSNESTEIKRQNIQLDGRSAYLEQNQPNPFKDNTLISYQIPTDAKNVVLSIFNNMGQLVHSERIAQTGTGQVQIKAGTIAAGTYSYSLLIDGNVIDTKRMVITK